jgi:hypothetical protein
MELNAARRKIVQGGCVDLATAFLRFLETSDASTLDEFGLDRCIV